MFFLLTLSVYPIYSDSNQIKNSDVKFYQKCLYFWFCLHWLILCHWPIFHSIVIFDFFVLLTVCLKVAKLQLRYLHFIWQFQIFTFVSTSILAYSTFLGIFLSLDIFLSAVWLPHSQLWTIFARTATLIRCSSLCLLNIQPEGHHEPRNEIWSLSPA